MGQWSYHQNTSHQTRHSGSREDHAPSDTSVSVNASQKVTGRKPYEMPVPFEAQQAEQKDEQDSNLVDWKIHDPENPLNWSTSAKCLDFGLVSLSRFLTPLASSMVAPVTGLILRGHDIDNETIGSFIVSIYVLGYALGPLVLSPLSEMYGRLPLCHTNNALFTLWNIGAASSLNVETLLAFRLLAGLAESCSVTIGSGSIADTDVIFPV